MPHDFPRDEYAASRANLRPAVQILPIDSSFIVCYIYFRFRPVAAPGVVIGQQLDQGELA